eukprot:TRINITY_DN4744_c0_g1_i1.p1 TRINITY_DN4744_c0_g1~~TRINITY_DN4744_c0_g1_i1.p1  ORF type:complete len:316 (-),score=87.37 TRINITY_DN4744_c0_g1_i1:1091-2038(-)
MTQVGRRKENEVQNECKSSMKIKDISIISIERRERPILNEMSTGTILYYNTKSVYSSIVRMTIEEKGLSEYITAQHIDLFSCQNYQPWFMRLNPNAQVPVLLVDDKPIYDSAVIINYLETIIPNPSLGLDDAEDLQIAERVIDTIRSIRVPVLFFGIENSDDFMRKLPDLEYFTVKKPSVLKEWASKEPELAPAYMYKLYVNETQIHYRLKDPSYNQEEWLRVDALLAVVDSQIFKNNAKYRLESTCVAGSTFSVLDAHLVPFLSMIISLERGRMIFLRPNLFEYWKQIQLRPSFLSVYSRFCDQPNHFSNCRCR